MNLENTFKQDFESVLQLITETQKSGLQYGKQQLVLLYFNVEKKFLIK